MRPPTNPKGVREFLGMAGYYRKFINRFADAARPLTKLTRKDCKFIWSDECQTGFEYLRTCLTESPILKYPDPHKRYVVFTDASDQAAAAVLTQEYIDEWSHNLQLTVLYMSLKLPHFAHHNVVRSLTSRVQLCCIQYRMRGYGLISRANYKLVSHV